MITLLSPSKTQEFTDQRVDVRSISHTVPALLPASETLVAILRRKSAQELMKLMKVSDRLARLNHEHYQHFSFPFTPDNARPALLAFRGDVYTDIEVEQYTSADFNFAQNHLRILSGLYGLLRPLDLIQPYRLEMKTPLSTSQGNNLYQFWGDRITNQLDRALRGQKNPTLVNLASQEYSNVVDLKKLSGKVITPVFKEHKHGKLSTVAIYAKRARGNMANLIIKHRIDAPEQLKTFNEDRYEYHASLSGEGQWVFVR